MYYLYDLNVFVDISCIDVYTAYTINDKKAPVRHSVDSIVGAAVINLPLYKI